MTASIVTAGDSPAPKPAAEAEPNISVVSTPQPGGKITRIEATPGAVAAEPRPAWLPEKFKSPEDLGRAYQEMERRMGAMSQSPAPVPAAPVASPVPTPAVPAAPAVPATPAAPAVGDLEGRIRQEFISTGQVSEDTRQAFTQRTGLSAMYIDQQLQYLQHQDDQARNIATQRLGGEAAVKELTDWAKGRLNPQERAAFSDLIYSGDKARAQLAIDGLAAKYEAEVGRAPRIIAGRRPQGDYGGVVPFQSEHELAAAMRVKDERGKSRYQTDPSYREQVEGRLQVSQKLGLVR